MKRVLRFTRRAALYLLFSALLALALFVSVLRLWLLPEIAEFRSSLEDRIGSLIGERVRIETLAARLRGFHPEIAIRGFHILDAEGRSVLRFATVRLSLDTFRTLGSGEPRFDRVEVVGPKLSIRRKPDGSIAILGLTVTEKPPAWLLAGGWIDLLDAETDWQDPGTGAPPLSLGRVDLRLRNAGSRHRLSAVCALPGDLGRSLRLVLDAEGDLFEAAGWRGTIYLEGYGLAAARLADGFPPSAFGVLAGTLDARIWLQWQGALQSMAGDFDFQAPIFVHRPESQTERRLGLKSLAGRFHWEKRGTGWRLDLNRFRPVLDRPWPKTRLAVSVGRQADGTLASISAAASHLDLADLERIRQAFPVLDGETGTALGALAPRGTMADLRGFYAPGESRGRRLALCGRFHDLAVQGWRSIPGFSGLGGHLCGTDAAGSAALSAASGRLNLAGLGLKRPVPLAGLEASLSWRRTDTGWDLDIPALSARNDELSLEGRARIGLPAPSDATSPFVDLQARIGGLDAARVHHYLPAALIPETAKWAERSLAGGRIPRWDILFRGHTADFPFRGNEGVFETEIDAENLALRYHSDWPPLTRADLRTKFRGPGATIDLLRGRIGAGRVVDAQGVIEDMDRNPRLTLTGRVQAGIPEVLEVLAHSPLRDIPERLGRFVSVSGATDIALNFDIPFNAKPDHIRVEGTASLKGATLRTGDPGLPVENLAGHLNFTREGLRTRGLRARILGEPAVIDMDHEDGEILVGIQGRAAVAALQAQFPAGAWRHAGGAADYRLDLRLPETLEARSAPVDLALSSDLVGISLDLPAPLGKAAPEPRVLRMEGSLRSGGKIPLRLAYGPDVRARFRLSGPEHGFRPEGGDLAIGQPLPPAEKSAGFTLAARMDALDAGEWWRWWTSSAAEGAGIGLLRELRLHFGKLAWNGYDGGRFALNLKHDSGAWQGRIDSAFAKGRISASPESVHLDLDSLAIPRAAGSPPSAGGAAPPADGGRDLDPAAVPGLHVRAKRLLWKGADLGPLVLDTERRAHGMIIQGLAVRTPTHDLALHGNWTRTPNRAASTHLEGKAHMDSLGAFLAALGHGGEVRETASDLEFVFDWPGAPYRFSTGAVTGEVKLNLGKGGLLNIEPGLGRVVGMLNLNSLWRRLSLDFSDLFGQGLAYDGLAGTFRIGDGQALTEAFLIDAVSAKILVTGRAGLVSRDLDQIVTVIPHTTAALPIAGALAGGPAVGAALYVAQQLVGEEVDRLAATHYAVRGGWDNPEITRINHNLPLDVLDRAWSGVKKLSGFGNKQEEQEQ